MKVGTIFALLLTCASCAPAPRTVGQGYFVQAVPFCQLMKERDRYRDREVLVSGLHISTPHTDDLYADDCENQGIELHGERGLSDNKHAREIVRRANKSIIGARVPVVFRGVLHAHKYLLNPNCNESCFRWSLERAQLLAADGTNVRRPPD